MDWYRPQFEQMKALKGPVWGVFHRPVWAIEDYINGSPIGDNPNLARAARDALAPQVTAFISGHHHAFEALSYKEDLPIQVISGHGGDELAMHVPPITTGMVINGATVDEVAIRTGTFGYSMLERAPDDATGLHWKLTAYDLESRVLAICDLNGRKLACQ